MLKWLKAALGHPPSSAASVPGAEAAADELQRKGNRLLDDGRLEEARRCYEEAAVLDRTAARLVNLGFVLKELGQPGPARQFLLEALALDPEQFDASFMLGSMAAEAGELAEARLYSGRAASLHPVCREALAGHAGVDFLKPAPGTAQVAAEAAEAAEAAIRQHADATEFFFFLGNIQIGLGDFAAAAGSFNAVLELTPDNPDGHYNLGVTAQMLGQHDAAIASFRKAVALRPGDVRSLCGLASSLTSNGQPTEAIAVCEEALALAADRGEVHNALGNALLTLGRHDEAIASYSRTIALQPDYAEAHSNIGMALTAKGQLDTAIGSLQRAVAIKPRYAEGHNNLGNALQQQGRFDDAMRSYGTAIAINPRFAQAHNNHGVAASAQGRQLEALASWRRALELKPDYLDAWSNSLYVLSFSTHITPADYLVEAKSFGAAAAARATPYAAWTAAASLRPDGVPLRVGFVSGDFREHPVGFFLEGVLQHLDPARVSAIAYTTNPSDDGLTARIKRHFAGWHSIVGLDDKTAAAKIHADGIHVLVDLA
ncbi:MAG: tetratricopeptide repeat protein, partial [Comamonadaceae bacterium]